MRIAGIVESLDHVCCRYRLRAFAPRLHDAGHQLDLTPLPRGWWQRLSLGRDNSDVTVLQRKLLAPIETTLLRRRAKKLIFDFDDAVWLRDSYSRKGFHDPKRAHRFQTVVGQCDAIAAGNPFLADYSAYWVRGIPIRVVPTCVDVHRYRLAAHDAPVGSATLVWIGSTSTLQGLQEITPWLDGLADKQPGLALRMICDSFLTLPHLRTEAIPWNEITEIEQLATADIGISHVPDDLWSRGKCGLKVLQYMAAGLPVIANPVGVQATMVRHGETGLHARTEREWHDAIRQLANDPDLRIQMGRAGRRLVEEKYSIDAGAQHWLNLTHRERKTA